MRSFDDEKRATCPQTASLHGRSRRFPDGSSVAGFKGLTPICRRPLTEVGRRGLGGCWRVQIHKKWFQHGSKMAAKSMPEAMGELLELSWQPGSLLEASWEALGGLQGRTKVLLTRSWALQDEFQDSFLRLYTRTEVGRVRNWNRAATRAEKHKTSKIERLAEFRHF